MSKLASIILVLCLSPVSSFAQMRDADEQMSSLEEFVGTAQEFSDWCLSPRESEVAEARTALSLLTRLYTLALELRLPQSMDYDLEGDRADDATWKRVFDNAAALPFNYYSILFNPHTVPSEEPVAADLADDIADIYRDLSEGLSLYAAGHTSEAEWTFVNSFTHWGRHALSATWALHCWLSDNGKW